MGCWRWIYDEGGSYTNWAGTEPDDGVNNYTLCNHCQNCAQLAFTGYWEDYWCLAPLSWICEYRSKPSEKNLSTYSYPKLVEGVFGNAVSFDGVDQYALVNYSDDFNLTEYTVVAIVKPKEFGWRNGILTTITKLE